MSASTGLRCQCGRVADRERDETVPQRAFTCLAGVIGGENHFPSSRESARDFFEPKYPMSSEILFSKKSKKCNIQKSSSPSVLARDNGWPTLLAGELARLNFSLGSRMMKNLQNLQNCFFGYPKTVKCIYLSGFRCKTAVYTAVSGADPLYAFLVLKW